MDAFDVGVVEGMEKTAAGLFKRTGKKIRDLRKTVVLMGILTGLPTWGVGRPPRPANRKMFRFGR